MTLIHNGRRSERLAYFFLNKACLWNTDAPARQQCNYGTQTNALSQGIHINCNNVLPKNRICSKTINYNSVNT